MTDTTVVTINLADLGPVKTALTHIIELHQPIDEEGEFFYDRDDGPSKHCEPSCSWDTCAGHLATVKVCRECGYENDGDCVTYRTWPCPTIQTLTSMMRAGDRRD